MRRALHARGIWRSLRARAWPRNRRSRRRSPRCPTGTRRRSAPRPVAFMRGPDAPASAGTPAWMPTFSVAWKVARLTASIGSTRRIAALWISVSIGRRSRVRDGAGGVRGIGQIDRGTARDPGMAGDRRQTVGVAIHQDQLAHPARRRCRAMAAPSPCAAPVIRIAAGSRAASDVPRCRGCRAAAPDEAAPRRAPAGWRSPSTKVAPCAERAPFADGRRHLAQRATTETFQMPLFRPVQRGVGVVLGDLLEALPALANHSFSSPLSSVIVPFDPKTCVRLPMLCAATPDMNTCASAPDCISSVKYATSSAVAVHASPVALSTRSGTTVGRRARRPSATSPSHQRSMSTWCEPLAPSRPPP